MEIQSFIETGNKLELKRIRRVKKSDDPTYVSRFLYKKSENEAVIDMPIYQGRLITLSLEEAYMVTFYTNKGLYQCRVEVVDRFHEDGFPVAVVRFQSAFEKFQRRQYYRMECIFSLTYRVVSEKEAEVMARQMVLQKEEQKREDEKKERAARQALVKNGAPPRTAPPKVAVPEEAGQKAAQEARMEAAAPEAASAAAPGAQPEAERLPGTYDGVTLDISGGGIRFNSPNPAEVGQVVYLQVDFGTPMLGEITGLFAKILTVSPVQNKTELYEHRAEFLLISNAERESIVRYIFFEERNRRKSNAT